MTRSKMMPPVLRAVTVGLCLLSHTLSAGPRLELRHGDRILFYGDSITQQNLYTHYIECLLLGAYPAHNLYFINMGWSGNETSDALARLERDILPVKPTVIFVNFGMNDGHYGNYNVQAYEDYMRNMTKLVDRLMNETGARLVLMTPNPVDPDTNPQLNTYNDNALALFSEFVNDTARSRSLSAVDQFQKFLQLQKHKKSQIIGFSVIPDGVHPNARGHLWTTYFAMKDLGLGFASQCVLAADANKIIAADNCTIENLKIESDTVSFTRTDGGIPLFLYGGLERKVDEDVPFGKEINNLGLRIIGLTKARYGVLADGVLVSGYSAADLSNGVNLATAFRGPWATAGEKIRRLSLQKYRLHFLEWREIRTGGLFDEPPPAEAMENFQVAAARLYDHVQSLQWKAAAPKPVKFQIMPARALEVAQWQTAGPYHAQESEIIDMKFDPENRPEKVDWSRSLKPIGNGEVNLNTVMDKDRGRCAYARHVFKGARGERLFVAIGALGSMKVFFNGAEVAREIVDARNPPQEKNLELALNEGDNVLLLKIIANANMWAFYCRGEILLK